MTNYRYAAKGPGGKTVEGTIEAQDRQEAVAELRRQNLVVVRVDEAGGARPQGAKRKGFSSMTIGKVKPSAKRMERVIFTRQLATMIGSGLSLIESLGVLEEQAESPGMKMTCQRLIEQVRGGVDLSTAMEQCPKAFTPLYISMVRAGEVSGQMDIIMERLADYLESSEELRREIRSAMTYPVVSLVLVLAITGFLMIGVVPGFRDVFDSLETELPGLTKFVLELSESLRENYLIMMGGVVAAWIAFVVFKKTKRGALICDDLTLRMPVFGPLFRKVALARFSKTFATLIRSGVPIMATLDIVADTAGNQVVSNVVLHSRESVKSGNLLSEPLSKSKVFPPMVTRMVAIGERTGALETLLEKISEFYDSQVKATVKSLTSMIEPIMITIMGVLVGGVVLAVFLPILDVVGKLSGN